MNDLSALLSAGFLFLLLFVILPLWELAALGRGSVSKSDDPHSKEGR
jgi:hypothetical protein